MSATASQPATPGRAAGDLRPDGRGAIEQAGERRSARVESLRALAALGVVVSHMFLLAAARRGIGDTYGNRVIANTGSFGLNLFFALSGYLLFVPFARHQFGVGQAIDLRRYARNRALRILPLYFSAVALLLIVRPFDVDRSQWWRFALFIQNYAPQTLNRLNAPLWTITVELQFYVVLPLLALLVARLGGRSVRRTVGVMLAIALASYALRSHEVLRAADPNLTGVLGKYALPTLLYAFVAGMLLAVLRLAWERRPPAWAGRPLLGSSGAWIAAGVALQLVISVDYTYQEPFVALVAALIVGGCVLPLRAGRVVRALQWRPLAMLGVASYSVYVWHGPIVVALSGIGSEASKGVVESDPTGFGTLLAVGLPLCIAAGALSYLVIERPFLRRRRRWGATTTTTALQPGMDAEAQRGP